MITIVMLPNPYTMPWQAWADTVVGYNPGLEEWVDPDEPWDQFAQRFCQAVPNTPRSDGFTDWRDWAAAAKSALAV